ncbi:Puromycin-sensitive aminopeptidase, putative [Perkinsus marinus ATCC 50983]|uniref:Aminopeptidase n=1 Tax=Perkinsus marinus (strain ATCC 50983 / TXsc) TaxID=423536 RepID=C5LD97_PERM5|nr:Puromycin-sensitive aminopeptidase, putative [Perkinsus marinus ATCC 50983]EER05229.1 Puromycin-sensitive aminopeptidase, putative [Perkinsus marinus ATCC 50983]|eukprot:XP_002773413.1 Puromycin-sensitive aminopeptidase, putative [Perkinsus marinus ATCC 50983]
MPGSDVLPGNIIVTEYEIHIKPCLDTFKFEGSSRIHLTVVEATTIIKLHAKELAFEPKVVFTPSGREPIEAVSVRLSPESTVVSFEFGEELPKGPGSLDVDYIGTINDQMAGFYRSSYIDLSGKQRYMGTTFFALIHARRAFPCVDEPEAKAVFRITISCDARLQAISNMPEASRSLYNGGSPGSPIPYQKVEFMPTPRMSTYLCAFCIGQFEFLQATTRNGTLVRTICTPGKKDLLHYALDCGVKSIEWYEDFFGMRYALPKMDMIAIPDFAMGAMENWGLVTYRETDLLCDPERTSVARMARVATVVAHELAHQWFGNLVTMHWWDELWLNEGFATFMQYLCTDALQPELGVWNMYISDTLDGALTVDGLRSSHPIVVHLDSAEEAEQVLDYISYRKGSAVVRLLWSYVGGEKFQKALQLYMRKHRYGNATTDDLWKAVEGVSGQPVKEMMDSWTDQMGYPVLEVGPRDSNGNCRVAQSWFLSDGSVKEGDEEKKWVVPILVGDDKTPEASLGSLTLLKDRETTVKVSTSKWHAFNWGAWVPYRVHYTCHADVDALLEAITSKELPVANRIHFAFDTLALCKAGRVHPEEIPKVLLAYREEVDPDVWDALVRVIGALHLVCVGIGKEEPFEQLVHCMIEPLLTKCGWRLKDTDTAKDRQLRAAVTSLAAIHCQSDAGLAASCVEMTLDYLDDHTSLADDVRASVFKLALAGGESSDELWRQLVSKAEDPATPQTERVDIYHAIG